MTLIDHSDGHFSIVMSCHFFMVEIGLMLDKVDKVAEMGVKNPKEDYTDVTLAVGDTFLDDFSGMVPPPT